MTQSTAPKVIELFAGAGLLGYAFREAGCVIEHAYEMDPTAVKSHSRNVQSDVTCVDLTKQRPTGKCDILIAGPPCQGFSTLGKQLPNDPRNSLSLLVADWACKLQPEIVVIENVAAFIETPSWIKMTRRLRRNGFHVASIILNAADYGVAQRRIRSFTIATKRSDLAIKPRRRPARVIRDAWRELPNSNSDGIMSYAPKPSELAYKRFLATPPRGDKRSIMESAPELAPASWWNTPNAVTDVWGRMNWESQANTLRTAFQNPSKGRYVHPKKHRVITLREGARLQGIPDRWQFEGSPTQIARQIGNGVPIPLGKAVARSVVNALN